MKKDYIKHVKFIFNRFRKVDFQVNILKCEFHI